MLRPVGFNPSPGIACRTRVVTTFALCAAAAPSLHTPMMRHSHTAMPACPALTPQSDFTRARTPHPLWHARGRRSPEASSIVRAPRWVVAFSTRPRARCERYLIMVPTRCSPTPRASCFHVPTTPLLSYRYVYMMLLDELGEVDGGAHLLGGALLSSPRTTRTSGIIADKHLGRVRDVVRVPFGTRSLQEAKEAGRRAQKVLEGRAGAGGGGSVAPVAWAGQGVKEPVRGGRPADWHGRDCEGRVDRDFARFCTISHVRGSSVEKLPRTPRDIKVCICSIS